MYIVGQEETVGESSVSSGCWGEDSDHKYGWARRTPTFVAPIRFSNTPFDSSYNPARPSLTFAQMDKQPVRMRTSANSNTLSNEALLVQPV